MQLKAGSDLVRRQNRSVVIAALRRGATMSRTDLCAATALSPSTVSAITSDLLDEGVLAEQREFEPSGSRRGRPQIAIGLAPARAHVACVELTHNQLSVGVSDYTGKAIYELDDRFSTAAEIAIVVAIWNTVGLPKIIVFIGIFDPQACTSRQNREESYCGTPRAIP